MLLSSLPINGLHDALKAALEQDLPGTTAQQALAPPERPFSAEESSSARQAAVLVLLYPDKVEQWRLLLIQRAADEGAHSQQIGFPGGQYEHGDGHLGITALREAEEETGLPKSQVWLIGWLSSLYIPVSHFQVYPAVAMVEELPSLRPDPREVSALLPMKIDEFYRHEALQYGPVSLSDGSVWQCPYFAIDGHCIWGATAMILNELLVLLNRVKTMSNEQF
jgi:8-oxo-dGTP pyrophosphatase MutT (NUDIX family)